MKKKISFIIAIVMVFAIALSLVGCGFVYIGDDATAKKNMKRLVTAFEKKDHNAMKALFAPSKIGEMEGFDESINELLSYYEGEHISHTSMSGMSSASKESNYVTRYHRMANDIVTTAGKYSVAITWYNQDDANPDNVGIWSLFILKTPENPRTDYSYWGDGTETLGVHIGLEHPTAVIYRLVDAIDNQDRDKIKGLFASNIISDLEGFDESIEELIAYYDKVDNVDMFSGQSIRCGKGKDIIYYKVSYNICDNQLFVNGTEPLKYHIAVEWHVADDMNAGNIGLWSLSILKYEEGTDTLENYWGDGEFTHGIHVAKPGLSTDME